MGLIFKGCIFRWHKAGSDDIVLRQWDQNIWAMVFTLLYLAKTKKVITEELRQHVFSDRKDRLPYSFMILIEENSVAWEPVELHKNTAPTNTQNNTPTVNVLNDSKNGTDKKCFQTVVTYSRFCVQKKCFHQIPERFTSFLPHLKTRQAIAVGVSSPSRSAALPYRYGACRK